MNKDKYCEKCGCYIPQYLSDKENARCLACGELINKPETKTDRYEHNSFASSLYASLYCNSDISYNTINIQLQNEMRNAQLQTQLQASEYELATLRELQALQASNDMLLANLQQQTQRQMRGLSPSYLSFQQNSYGGLYPYANNSSMYSMLQDYKR